MATKIATSVGTAHVDIPIAVKKVRVKIAKKTDVTTPVDAPEVAAPETPSVIIEDVPVSERMTNRIFTLLEKVTHMESTVVVDLKEMKAELKVLQKDLAKFQKTVSASGNKRKRAKNNDGTEAPRRSSGFQKPTGISDQLADFLNISRGSLLPRMEVTRKINEYIKENNLQNPQDRRKIIPNKDLHAILGTTAETEVSYFNYQGFLKGHFISTGAAPSEAPPS